MQVSRTVIISCAGMGNRLGLGTTKALVEVEGKPLIMHHLEKLKDESDIRVVVGYQAEKVINVVRKYRKDVVFVFNHNYRETGTGASVALASQYANEYILSLDGDLIIHPDDMKKILECDHEFVSGGIPEMIFCSARSLIFNCSGFKPFFSFTFGSKCSFAIWNFSFSV